MVKLRCKPGDIAMVTRTRGGRFLGMMVRVVERACDGFDWNVEILSGAVVGPSAVDGSLGVFRFAAVFDWNLTPFCELKHEKFEVQAYSARPASAFDDCVPALTNQTDRIATR